MTFRIAHNELTVKSGASTKCKPDKKQMDDIGFDFKRIFAPIPEFYFENCDLPKGWIIEEPKQSITLSNPVNRRYILDDYGRRRGEFYLSSKIYMKTEYFEEKPCEVVYCSEIILYHRYRIEANLCLDKLILKDFDNTSVMEWNIRRSPGQTQEDACTQAWNDFENYLRPIYKDYKSMKHWDTK